MIDFQAAFAVWLREELASRTIQKQEDIDELASELYETWLLTPQATFDGLAPVHFFDEFTPEMLVHALLAYAKEHKQIPDPLCDAITNCEECAGILIGCLEEPLTDHQNQAVLERLSEMQVSEMIEPCIRQVISEDDAKADQAVRAVLLFGQIAAQIALQTLQQGAFTEKVTDRLSDIISSCGPCEGAFEKLCEIFKTRSDARAFYAQCLAKSGDERALPLLTAIVQDPQLSYYDYLAIRDAVEELGGEIEGEREFSGDRDYMVLQNQDE